MPSEVDDLVQVDVAKLRGTEVMGRIEGVLNGTCFNTPTLKRLLEASEQLAVSTPEGAPNQVVLALQGDPAVVQVDTLIAFAGEVAAAAGLHSEAPDEVSEHRLRGKAAYGLHFAQLAPGLVLVASPRAFGEAALAYDVPARPVAAAPDKLVTAPGTVQAFSQAGTHLDVALAQVPADVGGGLRGAPMGLSVNTEADGVHVHLRAEMQSPEAVGQLLQNVTRRLRSASLVFRLMGLPALDQRLMGQQDGNLVDYRLHLSWNEAGRLLKLGEMEASNQVHKACDAGADRRAAGDVR